MAETLSAGVRLDLPHFDTLWNYAKPAETEARFREVLAQTEQTAPLNYRLELLTQIARCQGLQGTFDRSHATLDEVESSLSLDRSTDIARARYLLERGRAYNSSNEQAKAIPLFEEACKVSERADAWRYAIDAVHMIAISKTNPAEQVEWNLKGIALIEMHPDQQGWLSAFYNNIGESFNSLKDFANAKHYFHKLIEFQIARGGEPDMYTVKDEARATRLLGHPDESLAIVEPLYEKLAVAGPVDGWIEEELAESLQAVGRAEDAKPHFVKAFELLSQDSYCKDFEKPKLERLRHMAEYHMAE